MFVFLRPAFKAYWYSHQISLLCLCEQEDDDATDRRTLKRKRDAAGAIQVALRPPDSILGLSGAGVMVLVVSPDCFCIYANQTFTRATGFVPEDVVMVTDFPLGMNVFPFLRKYHFEGSASKRGKSATPCKVSKRVIMDTEADEVVEFSDLGKAANSLYPSEADQRMQNVWMNPDEEWELGGNDMDYVVMPSNCPRPSDADRRERHALMSDTWIDQFHGWETEDQDKAHVPILSTESLVSGNLCGVDPSSIMPKISGPSTSTTVTVIQRMYTARGDIMVHDFCFSPL